MGNIMNAITDLLLGFFLFFAFSIVCGLLRILRDLLDKLP